MFMWISNGIFLLLVELNSIFMGMCTTIVLQLGSLFETVMVMLYLLGQRKLARLLSLWLNA
ncbi:unnamed protein product [Prunus brigantina]